MTILTKIEEQFLEQYSLYDNYIYDVYDEASVDVVYPSKGKLTEEQSNYIINKISKMYPEGKITLDNKVLTIDEKIVKLNCINPILSEAIYKHPENSELKRIQLDLDFKYYNITEQKTKIKFGLINTVVYNESFLNTFSSFVAYDTNPCWYHVYDFEPKNFYGLDFGYSLVQPKFNFQQIINSELSDIEKLDILKELSNL